MGNQQSSAVCIAAVTSRGLALNFVINRTEEIILAAMRQNGAILVCVTKEEQTVDVCVAACEQYLDAFAFIKNDTVMRKTFETLSRSKIMSAHFTDLYQKSIAVDIIKLGKGLEIRSDFRRPKL